MDRQCDREDPQLGLKPQHAQTEQPTRHQAQGPMHRRRAYLPPVHPNPGVVFLDIRTQIIGLRETFQDNSLDLLVKHAEKLSTVPTDPMFTDDDPALLPGPLG